MKLLLPLTLLFALACSSPGGGGGGGDGQDVLDASSEVSEISEVSEAPDEGPDIPDEGEEPTQEPAWTIDSDVPQAGLGGEFAHHFSGYDEDGMHLYFCGDQGVFRVREPDGQWRTDDLSVFARINHCHAVSDDLRAAVGDSGQVWKDVGSGWSSNDLIQTGANLRGVWITDVGTLRVVGVGGTLYRLDNATWTDESPAGVDGTLEALWGADETTLYATGADGVLRYDGTSWALQTIPDDPPGTPAANQGFQGRAIWGASADQVWAVGERGKVLHWDGAAWTYQDAQWSVTSFVVVWGLSATDVYTLSVKGMARHYDGTSWDVLQVQTPMKTPGGVDWPPSLKVPPEPQLDYVGAYGTSPEDLYFFTSNRELIRYNDDYVL